MKDYVIFVHGDAAMSPRESGWGPYFARLQQSGRFDGGSAIGGGICVSKAGDAVPISKHLVGYIRVRAESIEEARGFVAGNPVYEAGGTVEIRELPREGS